MSTKDKKSVRLSDNKLFLIAMSFLLALVCWVAVVATVSTEQTKTIYNVPITMPDTPSYRNYGVEIVGTDISTVTVNITVKGDRSAVNSLKARDFTVTPIFNSVTEAGTYELAIQITKNNPLITFEITTVSPADITLKFAEVESQSFKITASADGVKAADGYLKEKLSLSQSEVIITGPKDELALISKVTAEVTAGKTASESFTETCGLTVYNAAGEKLDTANLAFSVKQVDVLVPIYKSGTVALDVGFTNIPDGFDISTLKYKLSASEITVAAAESALESLTTRVVGYIDLSTVDLNASYSFDVTLPTGVVNVNNVSSVSVTFERDDLASKRVNVYDLRIENGSGQYRYTLETNAIYNVTIMAHTGDINKISGRSAVAVIDVSEIVLDTGRYTVPVKIVIPGYDSAWAVGTYTAIIKVE